MHLEHLNDIIVAQGLPPTRHWAEHYDAILITGPTASGKSALGMALASLWPASIVSVDSALVYKGMDIGTAKPTALEQAEVPHHLIDLIDPAQSYNVAQFLDDCADAIATCKQLGRMPLLVGGTMMYVNALYKGLSTLPQGDAAVRQKIELKAASLGWPALHAELALHDPITARRLAAMDAQRIERALEVFYATGKPLSYWLENSQSSPALMRSGRWLHLSIEPEKPIVWQRIEQRFDAMLANGFLDEVRALKGRSDLDLNLPSMRCVGYRQAWEYLNGDFPIAELRERGVIATRQLAKRQMTWLRNMPQRCVIQSH